MFYERLEAVTKQMEELQKTMAIIKYKCWYYDTALSTGSEDVPKNMPPEEVPDEIPPCTLIIALIEVRLSDIINYNGGRFRARRYIDYNSKPCILCGSTLRRSALTIS